MPKKKPTHAIIKEMLLGRSVEDVIKEYFSEYELTDRALEQLPRLIREIVRINKDDVQFQVTTTRDESLIGVLNATSDFIIEYGEYDQEDAYKDCAIINEIVRRLYGLKKKRPTATLTEQEFVERNGEVCPYCKGNDLDALDETDCESVTMGCRSCGATWQTT